MDRKSLLAFVIIFLIILAMPSYFKLINGPETSTPENPPPTPTTTTDQPKQPVQAIPQESRKSRPITEKDPEEQIFTVSTDLFIAKISSLGGGTIKEFKLKKYDSIINEDTTAVQLINKKGINPLFIRYISIDGDSVWLDQNFSVKTISAPTSNNSINLSGTESIKITFELEGPDSETLARRTLEFFGNEYTINLRTNLMPLQQQMATDHYDLTWNSGLNYTEPNLADEARYSKAYAYSAGETDALDIKNNKRDRSRFTGQTDWTAMRTKYFTSAFISDGSATGYQLTASGIPIEGKNFYKKYSMQLSLSSDNISNISVYIGPLEYSTIKNLGVELEEIMSLGGFLKPISKAVLWIFIRLRKVLPNYGWVLIVFAFLIKIVLYPLTSKSMQSMKEMQKIQPKIEDLRKKHQKDPQKLNTEQMKLYKEHGVNPMGGCLPLLLQMPILIALFTVFRTTIELRHAPFIWWITDLSAPDTIYTLPFSIPLYGKHVNILPIIMALSTILQQKLSTSSSSNPQQKMMMYMMPIMFFFMFNQFPSGLNLYYTLFNLLTVAQQKFIPAKPKKKKKGPSTIDTLRQLQSKTKYR